VAAALEHPAAFDAQVRQCPVVVVSPDPGTTFGLGQLHRDSEPLAGSPDAALDDVARAKILSNLASVDRSALHLQVREPGRLSYSARFNHGGS
jgi:hypothetical protein